MSERLVDGHDVVLFDLDGVVYLGAEPVPGAPAHLAALREAGVRLLYVTNNAAPSADSVAVKLTALGIPAELDDIVTSAQVAVDALRTALPVGSAVLVAGSANLRRLCEAAGFQVTGSADDAPVAVLQGYDPAMTWPRLDEAALAVQRGAAWYATNDDATRPTERGLVPGLGAALYAVGLTVRTQPVVFGKPHPPMFDYAVRRTAARSPLFVGDRLDTDIAGAVAAGMESLFVLSGAHGTRELLAAGPDRRPTSIGSDVGALLRPPRRVTLTATSATCGAATVHRQDGALVIRDVPRDHSGQVDALWAAARLLWTGPPVTVDAVVDALDLLP